MQNQKDRSQEPKPKMEARLAFRLPVFVANEWRKMASDAGLSLSDFVREKVDSVQVTGIAPAPKKTRRSYTTVDPELLREINLIGNNLNQISRRVNFLKSQMDKNALLVELTGIRESLFWIIERFKRQG